MSQKVDLIVPVYNEPGNLATLYAEVIRSVKSNWQMYVIYDFDEDPTVPVIQGLAGKDSRVHMIKNTSRGVAHALRTGFMCGTADAVFTIMADDPASVVSRVDEIVHVLHTEKAAIVAPSRYMKGGQHWGVWTFKKILSYLAGATLHFGIGLPIHDATYATRCYRRSLLHATHIESTSGFEVALEITVKAHLKRERILEIPVVWTERVEGFSKFKLFSWLYSYAYWYFYAIVQYYFVRPFRPSLFARNAGTTQ